MKEFTIYAGEKLSGLVDDQASASFECDPTDADTAAIPSIVISVTLLMFIDLKSMFLKFIYYPF